MREQEIADYYGLENQILKTIEEASELATALAKCLASRTGKEIQEKPYRLRSWKKWRT